jgi:ketosteroid isomerase-like protein
MSATPLSSDPNAQLQWLVDRAEIGELLVDFARALDERDWEGYAANYAPEGALAFGDHVAHEGREGLAQFVSGGVGRYAATQHVSTNHAIAIDGDTAVARSYVIAAHVFGEPQPGRQFEGWGRYRTELRRTPQGWKIARARLDIILTTGDAPAH